MTEGQWLRARRTPRSEEEWLACQQPHLMLKVLHARASDRKARLFESVCLRRLWHWPEVQRRWAVEALERQADGAITREEARPAALALREAREFTTWVMGGLWNQAFTEGEDHEAEALPTAGRTCEAMSIAAGRLARREGGLEEGRPEEEHRAPERSAQCHLLRCIFGNPFRPPPPLNPSLLTHNDGLIMTLALAAYEERLLPSGHLDADRLAVLADALEEAGFADGCDDAGLLRHLRAPGPHVRGCWAVDAVLGQS